MTLTVNFYSLTGAIAYIVVSNFVFSKFFHIKSRPFNGLYWKGFMAGSGAVFITFLINRMTN